jgi:hypothetical protein
VKIVAAVIAVAVAPVLALVMLLGFVVVAAGGPSGAGASPTALADIPTALLPVYRAAAASCPLPWAVLAAIGKVESDHARATAPGVRDGQNFAGAEGPLQFLPATWGQYGVDGDRDGDIDVYDPVDAIWGAARMLCANGAGEADRLAGAIFAYNHDDWYVREVLEIAARYAASGASSSAGPHTPPLDAQLLAAHPEWLISPHHDYPAIDIPVPVGTSAYAVVDGTVELAGANVGNCGGTVVLDGDDGITYTYCHASLVLLQTGAQVRRGQLLLLTGGAIGSAGAGSSTGPHLHFDITVGGVKRCPQPVLQAWVAGHLYDPSNAPASGCTVQEAT